jgi:hypothetical protein
MNPYSPPAPAAAQYPATSAAYGPAYGPAQTGAVSETAVDELRQTRPWVIFMSVVMFLEAAFTLLGAISMFAVGALLPATLAAGPAGGAAAMGGMMGVMYGGMGIFYLVMAAACIYPGIKLWSYGSAIGRLLSSRATVDLEDALKQQKSYWKFWGITVIVLVALGILFFIAMMIVIAAGVSKAAGSITP